MKTTSILKIAVLALPLVFSACKSHKKVAQPTVMTPEMIEKADFISSVKENAQMPVAAGKLLRQSRN